MIDKLINQGLCKSLYQTQNWNINIHVEDFCTGFIWAVKGQAEKEYWIGFAYLCFCICVCFISCYFYCSIISWGYLYWLSPEGVKAKMSYSPISGC